MVKFLEAIKVNSKALVVTEGSNKNVQLSARNIQGVKTASAESINVVDLLKHDVLVISKQAVIKTEEVYGNA
jgi:large subunit ribosomal protein L4